MGMDVQMRAASPLQIEMLRADPRLVKSFMQREKAPSGIDYVDIDKAWDAINFMLTGTRSGGEYPLSAVIFGGQEIGDDFGGYGPANLVLPHDVQAIARALSVIDEAVFRVKYDAPQLELNDVYPSIWTSDRERSLDYVVMHYLKLVEFYREAAKRGDGVIILLS